MSSAHVGCKYFYITRCPEEEKKARVQDVDFSCTNDPGHRFGAKHLTTSTDQGTAGTWTCFPTSTDVSCTYVCIL